MEELKEETRRRATKCDIGKSCGTAASLKENKSKEKEEVVAEVKVFGDWGLIKEEESWTQVWKWKIVGFESSERPQISQVKHEEA